ncbi:MAG: ABC transporter permease subunit [Actinomycetota bacterium]|nr:ABC transporter permease subunit [Actinomycetota bacterium]
MRSLIDSRMKYVVLPMAALAIATLVLPLVALVIRTPFGSFFDHLGQERTRDALRVTAITSSVTTLCAIAFGVPLAAVLAAKKGPLTTALRAIVTVPMVLPPVAGGIALVSLLGRRGVLGSALDEQFGLTLLGTPAGVVIAQLFVSLPFLVVAVEAGFHSINVRQLDAAATLGASPSQRWRLVGLPMLRPALIAGATLTWARAVGELGATITFAGSLPGQSRTVPTEVLLLIETDPGAAAVLSVVLLVASAGVLVGLRGRWLGRIATP